MANGIMRIYDCRSGRLETAVVANDHHDAARRAVRRWDGDGHTLAPVVIVRARSGRNADQPRMFHTAEITTEVNR